jgi:hypothetical protein
MAEIRANNVPTEFLKAIDIECAKRGRLSMREAAIQAFTLWLGQEPPTQKTTGINGRKIDQSTQRVIDLFTEARTVQNAEWQTMLGSILSQLETVAHAARSERNRDVPPRGDGDATGGTTADRAEQTAGATRNRGRK